MAELFDDDSPMRGRKPGGYTAEDIEVLEGLEPVRRRPGMYIGGTDENALHHLVAEILDNAMDEAVAGHASRISLQLDGDQVITVSDDGRGIPVDPHPRFPDKSALEVILTTLHAGGKFSGKAYQTAGGLHGVGLSVVNALSAWLEVEVMRDGQFYRQLYRQGRPEGPLEAAPIKGRKRGTTIRFRPDPQIFGRHDVFRAERLYRLARSKAYLFRGVTVAWQVDPDLCGETPERAEFHYARGLVDYIEAEIGGADRLIEGMFSGEAQFPQDQGRLEWACAWSGPGADSTAFFLRSYCNTIPTPQGGTHENGLRTALTRSLREFGEMTGNRKAAQIQAEDLLGEAGAILSVFIREPLFQGQTKERLANAEVARWVETAVKDHFDHWLAEDAARGRILLDHALERAEARARRKEAKETARQTAARRLRLPGKLTDCASRSAAGTEIFIVEGDSAGGTAMQARRRETQAVLPLRGKILNVASATREKMRANQEVQDLALALGCGIGKDCDPARLRYERVIIMTDADVDGAHIAALLMTFFFTQMRPIVEEGALYLAMPPLYRLAQGNRYVYARDERHKDALLEGDFFDRRKRVDVSRFKGLGEMPFQQLRETTMNPDTRALMRVVTGVGVEDAPFAAADRPEAVVERLMGRQPEMRFRFVQENARFAPDLDI